MYSEAPVEKSARHLWEQAPALARRALLREAGYRACLAYAYRHFDELPLEVKVDLNRIATRIEEGKHHAKAAA